MRELGNFPKFKRTIFSFWNNKMDIGDNVRKNFGFAMVILNRNFSTMQ